MTTLKKLIGIIICVALLLSASACETGKKGMALPEDGVMLRCAVLYSSSASDGSWEDVYSRLSQPLLLSMETDAVDVDTAGTAALSGYDVLYPDTSVMSGANAADVRDAIVAFVSGGGSVMLKNEFYNFFEPEFIGAKKFVKLDTCPASLELPRVGEDLGSLRQIISDFAELYTQYVDYDRLAVCDYGYGVVTGSAKELVKYGDFAIYTMNKYGDGSVFFTNPLLPNELSINGLSLTSRSDVQKTMASTTISANQILENGFAAYAAKQRYGFALYRIYGAFTRPSMAWELHYEDMSGIANGSSVMFSELCMESLQMPSFTIVRNSYNWNLRTETVTYLLGKSGGGFTNEFNESAYSSGTHIDAGGEWLELGVIEHAGSYFIDYPEYDKRAYADVCDMDGDGVADIICGCADGKLYFYSGEGMKNGRWTVSEPVVLTDSGGNELAVTGYSAPEVCDVDGDGIPDIICGGSDGALTLYRGLGGMKYSAGKILLNTGLAGQALPETGDMDGDGKLDLLVGSNEGKLLVYYGASGTRLSVKNGTDIAGALAEAEESFLSPCLYDMDGDGENELYVGTFDGYVLRADIEDRMPVDAGFVTADEWNYKGNANIKIGNYITPRFADIDGDGAADLIASSLEYGPSYPIDSEYFEYSRQLREQLDYMKENYISVGIHFLTNRYASAERERFELESHMAALAGYGVDTSRIGVNQHTWHTSSLSPVQSFMSAWNAGALWNSGFEAPGSEASPEGCAENVIALPFYLTDGGERTILLQNNSMFKDDRWCELLTRYGMPACMYSHCDFIYQSDEEARWYIDRAEWFRDNYAYDFTTEEQMMLATAAALNLTCAVSGGDDGKLSLTLTPGDRGDGAALYDDGYQGSCGARIEFGECYDQSRMKTDASVWYRDGNSLCVSLENGVSVYEGSGRDKAHISQINIAAYVLANDNGASVEFLDDGMMQLTVTGKAATDCEGWTVTEKSGNTTFTKYGAAERLTLTF